MQHDSKRINVLIGDIADPFWGQVMEGMHLAAQENHAELVYLQENLPTEPNPREENDLLRELSSLHIDTLIHWGTSPQVVSGLLQKGTRLIQLTESDNTHPHAYAPLGLADAAAMAAEHIAVMLGDKGRVLMAGGMLDSLRHESGRSRVSGFTKAMQAHPGIQVQHMQCAWDHESALLAAQSFFAANPTPFDAIFGLSDSVALATRLAAVQAGCLPNQSNVVGINGDPAALHAIALGQMAATIETSAVGLGHDAVTLAVRLMDNKDAPKSFPYRMRVITPANVQQASAEKLYALAGMPQRMIGMNRQATRQQTLQLETAISIMETLGGILDLQKLSFEAAERIRTNYGYDTARLLRVEPGGKTVQPLGADFNPANYRYIKEDTPLTEVLRTGQPVLATSQATRQSGHTRLLMPIHFGGQITHILEMGSQTERQHRRTELASLQSLADLIGIAIRNAELYQEATLAREQAQVSEKAAEKADNLKSRLLANVSAELRNPLRNIIHHTRQAQSVLHAPGNPAAGPLDPYLSEIEQNSEMLNRLITDLLDLSRAEVNELELNSHMLNPAAILREAFAAFDRRSAGGSQVRWKLDLPHTLPFITADPQRILQVFINLLANAARHTRQGEICLSARVDLPYLRVTVRDTGDAMPQEVRDALFDPFSALLSIHGENKSLGIGLTIARRLVALHSGSLKLDERSAAGNAISVLLPLPTLGGEPALPQDDNHKNEIACAWVPCNSDAVPEGMAELCLPFGLQPQPVTNTMLLTATANAGQSSAAALACQVGHTNAAAWTTVQKLAANPSTARLPFLFFPHTQGQEDNALAKPEQFSSLRAMIEGMKPTSPENTPLLLVDSDRKALAKLQAVINAAMPQALVHLAETAAQAMQALQDGEAPSLVVMALNLEDMDGFSLLRQVREAPETASVPVVLYTTRELTTADLRLMDHDKILFITKNLLTNEELVERFMAALDDDTLLPRPTSSLVKRSIAFIHENYPRPFTLQQVTYELGVSKSYFSLLFRREMGLSLWDYLNRYRVLKAKELLRNTTLAVNEISVRVGFEDFSYFGRLFSKQCKCSPREYRKKRTRPVA